jgi:hypothetical protein
MLWILASLFFCWCVFHEIRASVVAPPGYSQPIPVSVPYLVVVSTLALLLAWPPVHTWFFERFLAARATQLAEPHRATVHCNTVWDTMLDPAMLASAHADPATGHIGIQHPWCSTLRSYLAHPGRASDAELWALAMFTHESMHVRGELNEARTECQAVQRNYRAAKLLGVADGIARRNALDYYNRLYKMRRNQGPMQGEYYSDECAPGGALDEHLTDSTWAQP